MESIAEQMIGLLISRCKNRNIKKGLEIALSIIQNQGYYNINDWEELTYEEQWNEIKDYLK